MAEGGEEEWELSKENVKPLRRGRAISALNQALSQQLEGQSVAIDQQRQAFEYELRMYEGDDPLDVWDRYIKWTEQMFPQGGKQSNYATLLERAVTKFTDEQKYHNDPRYVDLWIKFGAICTEPLDIYNYMEAQGIGVMQASFYIAWAEEHERLGNTRKADIVYQEGLRKKAEPEERLEQFHKALQARVSRQAFESMTEGNSDEETKEPERVSLVDLKHRGKKKAVAPINRTGPAVKGFGGGLQSLGAPASSSSNSRFLVFDENRAHSSEASDPKLESWAAPPAARAKENEQKPGKWCDEKMPQRSRFRQTVMPPPPPPKATFQPFVEEPDQPPAMTPCKINPAVNTVLSARKPCREETPLKRLQEQTAAAGKEQELSMYCKDLLFSGATELCFEELRAERYRQKMARGAEGQTPSQQDGNGEGEVVTT